MAREIRTWDVTTPPGTLQTAPLITSLAMPVRAVQRVQVQVPPGPAGNVGFYLAVSGQQVIPYTAGDWITTDNEVIDWDLQAYPDSGAWSIATYNTGLLPHTIYVRMGVGLPAAVAGTQQFTPLPAAAVNS